MENEKAYRVTVSIRMLENPNQGLFYKLVPGKSNDSTITFFDFDEACAFYNNIKEYSDDAK